MMQHSSAIRGSILSSNEIHHRANWDGLWGTQSGDSAPISKTLNGMLVAISNSEARLKGIEERLEWSSIVQSTLPQELYQTSESVLRRYCPSRRVQTLPVRNAPLSKLQQIGGRVNDDQNLRKSPFKGQADNPISLSGHLHASSEARFQKREKKVFAFSYRTFLGCFELNVYQQYHWVNEDFNDRIEIELLFSPNFRYFARAARLWLFYDRTHGLSSPTNLHLCFPCVRPISDPIVQMVEDGMLQDVVKAFTAGDNMPNDLYVHDHHTDAVTLSERRHPGHLGPDYDHNFQQSLLNVGRSSGQEPKCRTQDR